MPRRSSWSISLVCLVAAAAAPRLAAAATQLERSIDVEVRPDGSVSERTHLRVRLDGPNDFARWSPYYVYLDDNRELTSLEASATGPDGKTLKVSRRDLDTQQLAGRDELHSSRSYRTVAFPPVPVGSVLAVDFTVKEKPWFPGGDFPLGSQDAIESLRVAVHGAGAGWRWRVDGSLPGLAVQESPGGVTVTAAHLPALVPPAKAPDSAGEGAVLRYAWGNAAGWDGVGRWFEGLLTPVPRNAEPVRRKARELIASLPDKRQRMEALVDFTRRQVRYVAVEVGIGGYRPAPPQQVTERLWGDCKDKALLLTDLLHEAGIEAYPALIRLDPHGRVDREFPSPFQFNHMIVAVPAEGLGLSANVPVANGFLFLDATQREGGLEWLNPGVQDQEALVVKNGQGILVRTPILQAGEGIRLTVELALAPSGDAAGSASLELTGEPAAAFQELHSGGKPQELDRAIRHVFAGMLPAGVTLAGIRWQSTEGGAPFVKVDAQVSLPALGAAAEAGALPPIPMPGLVQLPSPGLLENRTYPVVASPFSSRTTWRVTLPQDSCKPEGQDVTVGNDVGAFRQTTSVQGKLLVVERQAELRQRWIEPAAFPALKEISLAESRANKRRLRLSCRVTP
ncbi:MAG TPA: DUF3857 domain-containing protein [Thermoanaerobaculia bacterium]|nr:DUF3857 domain-containing protein [Thermoanaerobaculia bacterium]